MLNTIFKILSKMKKVVPILLLALLFNSCSYHTGNISTGSSIDCPLMYIASGTASTTRFFEIGGNNKDALIIEAKNDLYRKFPYTKGIKLSNFSVDYKSTFFFPFHSTKVTVSADVYNCNITIQDSADDQSTFRINGFKIGDSVFIYSYASEVISSGKIIGHLANNMISVDDGGSIKDSGGGTKYHYSNIYRAVKDPENVRYFGFDIGEKFMVPLVNFETGVKNKRECTIVGINQKEAVVEFKNSTGNIIRVVIEKEKLIH